MTEHDLQRLLTTRWLAHGIELEREFLHFAAWEVMLPSWRINYARTGFGEPAIDFIGIDRDGGLVAIELKVRVGGPKDAMRGACQASYLAAQIDETKSLERLTKAHEACVSGRRGRASAPTRALPEVDLSRNTRAVLAAAGWSSGARATVEEFGRHTVAANTDALAERGMLSASRTNLQCRRFATLAPEMSTYVQTCSIATPADS